MPAPAPTLGPLAWRAAYHLAAGAAATIALPVVLLGGLVRRGWWAGLAERLGAAPRLPGRPVWFHAASVGEQRAFEPLARALRERHPELDLALSVTTPAGRLSAASLRPLLAAPAFQLPADAAPLPGRALARLRPRALVLVETELWPNLLGACHRRGLPVALVNGRIEERSFRRYLRLRPLLAPLLKGFRLLAMRSPEDARRALALGAPADRLHVTGNLKFDAAARQAREWSELPWARAAGLDRGRWIVAGSTAAGEEEALLAIHARLSGRFENLRLALAPRRPERWDEVAGLVRKAGLPLLRRSALGLRGEAGSAALPPGAVLLLDTVGELARLYRHAELAFLGGSLVPRGGQNPLEAAAAGVPVIVGPQAFHFRDVERILLDAGAACRVRDASELEARFGELLGSSERRLQMGRAGLKGIQAGEGAADRTLELLAPLLHDGVSNGEST